MKRRAVPAWGVFLLLSCGCAGVPSQEGASLGNVPAVAESRDRLEATGIGAPNPLLPSETQRKATARDAALIKARYQLSAAVRALVLETGITLEAATEMDSNLEDRVKRAVQGARTATEFTPDDGCLVRLILDKRQLGADLGVRFK